jgi:dihydrofolate reductase
MSLLSCQLLIFAAKIPHKSMRKIILYTACSVDGFIAEGDGSIEWLNEMPNPDNTDYGYHGFFESVDTLLIGHKTYKQVMAMGKGNPYAGKKSYVITTQDLLSDDADVEYLSKDIPGFIHNLKAKTGADIWCVGGGALNALLIDHGLLDELKVFVMPIVLGAGVALAPDISRHLHLKLLHFQSYRSGAAYLHYQAEK